MLPSFPSPPLLDSLGSWLASNSLVTQADLELSILQAVTPECWDH